MTTHRRFGAIALTLLGGVFATLTALAQPVSLLNVSYDPTRELYAEYNTAFAKYWKGKTGQDVSIKASHDLDVARYTPGGAHTGIVAKLTRAIVVGPVARLELEPVESHFGKDAIIEAQLSASQYRQQDFKEGETLVLTPRKARVFVEG